MCLISSVGASRITFCAPSPSIMMVSSGAFFGIRGRFIGSGPALAIALGFAAVMVWTSGDAIVAAAHRILHRQYWCCWPLLDRTALGCR